MTRMVGVIGKGTVTCLYSDALLAYTTKLAGTAEHRRASYVEPDPENSGHWMVDFQPLGGGVYRDINGVPFRTRGSALAFEVSAIEKWLQGDQGVLQGGHAGQ